MKFLDTNKPCVSFNNNLRVSANLRLLVKVEIMAFAVGERRANDTLVSFINYNQTLHSMAFLFAGIPETLFFWGLSTGLSDASYNITS